MIRQVNPYSLADCLCLDNFENKKTSNNLIANKIHNRISNIPDGVVAKGFERKIVLKNKLNPVLKIHMKWREVFYE